MDGKNTLNVEPNPSPKAESHDFSNADDRRRGQDYAHELALVDREQGPLGRLIGSKDSSLTIAFIVIAIAGVCIVGSLFGMVWHPEMFLDAVKFFGTVMLTVAGYVFGVTKDNKD